MPGTGWPTLAEVKTWLRLTDEVDDAAITQAMDAAAAALSVRVEICRDYLNTPLPNEDLRLAYQILVSRLIARRNSPDGLVGFMDFGGVRVPRFDPDVEFLIAPYLPVVVA